MIAYETGAVDGSSAPSAWHDFLFDLATPYFNDCELDPAVWGSDPYAIFTGTDWEMAFEPMDQSMTDIFIKILGSSKFQSEYEPYFFGVSTYQDGSNHSQTEYGYGWPVVGGTIDDSADLLTTEQVAAGADGWYTAQSMYIYYI